MGKAHLNPKCLLSSFAYLYYKSCLQSRTTYSHISSCKLSFLHFSLCELCSMVKQWSLLGLGGRWQVDYGVETSRVSIFLPSALDFTSSRSLWDILVLPPCAGLWWAQCSTCCVRSWKLRHQSTGVGDVACCPLGWRGSAWAVSLLWRSWDIFFCPWRKHPCEIWRITWNVTILCYL